MIRKNKIIFLRNIIKRSFIKEVIFDLYECKFIVIIIHLKYQIEK